MSGYMEAPDGSFRVSDDQAEEACRHYHHFAWDVLEAEIPDGAIDTSGVPIDRHNRNIQLAAMSTCLSEIRGDKSGRGMDRLSDEHWLTFVSVLLDSYHKTIREGNPDE